MPHQDVPLAFWPDRTVKWLLVDCLATVTPSSRTTLSIRPAGADAHERSTGPELRVTARAGGLTVDTGRARFDVLERHQGPLASVTIGTANLLDGIGSELRLTGRDNQRYSLVVERLAVEEEGPIRASLVSEGWFSGPRGVVPLRFTSRAVFVAGSSAVSLDLQIRNTQPAVHPGGLWDLGDPGSWRFDDLSLWVHPRGPIERLGWVADAASDEREETAGRWAIYQDSSGGDLWDSPNHVGHDSKSTVAFRGYRVTRDADGRDDVIATGHRATPRVLVVGASGWIAAATRDFWQNFPKALRWHDGALSLGLFPGESSSGFELQGGEQKRHTLWLEFGAPADSPSIAALQHPVVVSVDPAWVESAGAIAWFAAPSSHDNALQDEYLRQIVEGPRAFVARREIIDEYGWRNFGDLYADHEAVRHRGPQPFVSHYNNQYDFIYGAFVHFQRSGDARWRELMDDLARHVIDIDIYHTQGDKAAFNGGLFWHTDHYLPAATCTHRTYSRSNRTAAAYGGGPSNEHNYTSGLLHYYYLTGDREAASAVRELADWVIGMDDGSQTIFGLVDAGPTGLASKTLEATYHHPGRGAANAINALLDAYSLSRDRHYMAKAEELLQRCIHPADDISALQLDDPEHRWSYLVFLQVLGTYLLKKREIEETDYAFHYGHESLLHYARWMADHEVPYKDVLHKVELPTETWPAHDVRKSHVLRVAATFAAGAERERFRARAAFFFDRCLTDLLGFSTSHLTRPLVILSVYGSIESYFLKYDTAAAETFAHNHAFGVRRPFVPQSARVRGAISLKLRVLKAELARVVANRLHSLGWRLPGSR